MEKPLVDNKYLLERFDAKGGWTYAVIPEVLHDKTQPFGWVRVKGSVDDHAFKGIRLMPMGNGKLFFPLKAEIRKKINKQEGDWVKIVLYPDNDPLEIPDELLVCLLDDKVAHQAFLNYSDGEQRMFFDWIFSAKTDKTKVDRIAKTMEKLVRGLKFADKL